MRYTSSPEAAPTSNPKLQAWVERVVDLCDPGMVWWCDGSTEEYEELAQIMTETGTARWLDPELRPNSRSHLHLFPASRGRRTDEQLG